MIRTLRLAGEPRALGAGHGAAYAADIRRYTEERVHLAAGGKWAGGRAATRADVLALAEEMLPDHARYAPDVYAELLALAEAAGITPAEAVIVGGFTDFVDAVRARAGAAPEEDDCTAVLIPDHLADGAGYLAQTWDMHDSATEHVLMLELHPAGLPAALVFTTVGCVAQIGLNAAGIAVGINNLTATDGRVGVTWPFVVRKILAQRSLDAALDCILSANLAGGHDYLLLDATGRGYNVEAMPTHVAVTPLADVPLAHTNHVLDPEGRKREAVRAPDLVASSLARLETAHRLVAKPRITRADLEALTREPDAICRKSEPPHHMETSGAAILRPKTRELWAVWGLPSENPYERFSLEPG